MPVGVDQTVGDQRVDAGHDVAHRAVAPVAVVGTAEVLAVALGPARVAGVDADAGRHQALPFPHQRPAIQRGRAAVDLDHQRRRLCLLPIGRVRNQPWMRRPSLSCQRSLGATGLMSAHASPIRLLRRRRTGALPAGRAGGEVDDNHVRCMSCVAGDGGYAHVPPARCCPMPRDRCAGPWSGAELHTADGHSPKLRAAIVGRRVEGDRRAIGAPHRPCRSEAEQVGVDAAPIVSRSCWPVRLSPGSSPFSWHGKAKTSARDDPRASKRWPRAATDRPSGAPGG